MAGLVLPHAQTNDRSGFPVVVALFRLNRTTERVISQLWRLPEGPPRRRTEPHLSCKVKKIEALTYISHLVPVVVGVAPALPYSSTCSGTENTHTLKEIVENEEAEGFLTYRVADRRCDYS